MARKHIELAMKVLLYATFFVPLIVASQSFIFPFIVPKVVVLRSLILLLFVGYAVLLYQNWPIHRPRVTALSLALLGFVASFALSTFLGVDPYHSFWDNHERMLGLFAIVHYLIYYFVATTLFKTWGDWKWALRMFLLAGSIVMFIGVLQKFNPELLLNQGSGRVRSTLGNAIYMGGYGLFLWFVALLLMVKEKHLGWSIAEGLLGVLAFFGMLFSGTRGSYMGFIAGIGILMLGYLVTARKGSKARMVLGSVVVLGVIAFGVLFWQRDASWVRSIPIVGRVVNISFSEGTGATRLIAWQAAIEGWKERPVFGWGPNNYFYAFNAYYNPRSLEFGFGETWFDNAHNILLNTLAVQGAVGLFAYLGIFAAAIVSIFVASRKQRLDKHIAIFGTAFLVAHLVQNISVFENLTSYLYFMFWLAMVNGLADVRLEKESVAEGAAGKKERAAGFPLVAGALALSLFLIFLFNIQPARANKMTLRAMTDLARSPEAGIASIKTALAFPSPHRDDIRMDLSRMIVEYVRSYAKNIGPEKTIELVGIAEGALYENLALHPRDIRVYMSLAELNQFVFFLTQDRQRLLDAEGFLNTAIALSPKRQQLLYMQSTVELQLGKIDEGIALLEQSLEDDPVIAEGWWRLAATYRETGQTQKAIETAKEAQTRGIVFDQRGQAIIDQVLSLEAQGATSTAQ